MSSIVNKIFDEVYVINLDRAPDRLQVIDTKLKKLGIRYKRLSAVDGRQLSAEIIDKEATAVCANFAIYGAIGCALSHKTVWKNVVQRGLKQVLVLEDDANPADNFDERFLASWQAVPPAWDIVHLGSVLAGGDRDQYTWFDWLATLPLLIDDAWAGHTQQRGHYVDAQRKIVVPDMNGGCHAYAITRDGCRKLLASISKISYPGHIDILISQNSRDLNRYAVADPTLVTQPTMTEHSSIATTGLPHLGNYLLDKVSLTRRGTRAGWVMSGSIARIGSSVQLSCWRVLWFLLGFWLGLGKLPIFAAAMLVDDVVFGNEKNRNINQLIFDISLFATGAILRSFFSLVLEKRRILSIRMELDFDSDNDSGDERTPTCQCCEINRLNREKFNHTGTFQERFQALNDPKGARPPPPVSCHICRRGEFGVAGAA